MRRWLLRHRIAVSAFAAALLSVGVAWWWLSSPRKEPTAAQIEARTSDRQAVIAVGPNIRISKDNDDIHHRECVVAADPSHPERLVVFAIYDPPGSKGVPKTVGYRSEDGGKTWTVAFERKEVPNEAMYDPAIAFGPDGTCYYVCMSFPDKVRFTKSHGDILESGGLVHFRSANGGKTWEPAATIPQFTDRPFLAVDCSNSRYRGRVYCEGSVSTSVPPGMPAVPALKAVLHTSTDSAKTFDRSRVWHRQDVDQTSSCNNGNVAVLSDGTVAFAHYAWLKNPEKRPQIRLVLSDDGGETLREGSLVDTYWYDAHIKSGSFFFPPQLASDARSPNYLDRLYLVWEDGPEPNRIRIMFAYSPDKGRSWIGPTILSEQPTAALHAADYGSFLPSLAVNKDGAIAVTWYDRRGLPDLRPGKPVYPPGCNVRMRVSLDGGETWQASVQLNEHPIKASCDDFKDTAGLAADADGAFHPVWIDDRTGKRQVWTAKVVVDSP